MKTTLPRPMAELFTLEHWDVPARKPLLLALYGEREGRDVIENQLTIAILIYSEARAPHTSQGPARPSRRQALLVPGSSTIFGTTSLPSPLPARTHCASQTPVEWQTATEICHLHLLNSDFFHGNDPLSAKCAKIMVLLILLVFVSAGTF